MSKGSNRRQGKGFEDNFDKIFGSKKEREAKYADSKFTNVAKHTRSHNMLPDFVPFQSPIDKKMITCRSKLRAHNKKHGVTDMRAYGDKWFKRKERERSDKITGNTKQAHKERIETVKKTLETFGVYKP